MAKRQQFVAHSEERRMPESPTLSRRHAAGAATARGLLFTVLGEFVLPGGGAAWTSALIDVLARLGVEEKATRQALMRTAGAGWLAAHRAGRRTRWQLTPAAERLLVDGTERIFGFDGQAAAWDGRWLLVLARAPETERAARHLLRSRLTWAGLGAPAPGVWIGPHVGRLPEVEAILDQAGMASDGQVFVAEHRSGADIRAMVAQAWDLDAIEAEYQSFLDEFSSRAAPDPLAATAELVHAWRRFPWIDPALPASLLPPRWSGTRAAQLFRRRHAEWVDAGRAQWGELNEQAA
jgi:phenylacetic acid degradation operon negative regulatory protein